MAYNCIEIVDDRVILYKEVEEALDKLDSTDDDSVDGSDDKAMDMYKDVGMEEPAPIISKS